NGSSGFSAASPVLFEWSAPWDDATAKAALVAFDLTTGKAEPLRENLSLVANSQRIYPENKKPVMDIHPRTRWQFGHRYVVAVTNALKNTSGESMPAIPGFRKIIEEKSADYALYADALSFLAQQGVSENNLLIATVFTVRAEEEVTSPLLSQVDTAYKQAHPVRNLRVAYPDTTPVGVNVYGEVRLTSFRDEEGFMRMAEGDEGDDYWTSFVLSIPRAAKNKPAPVAIYGHGISINKESAAMTVTIANAQHGVATFAIDQPNHGDRQHLDGGYIFNLVHPQDVIRLLGIITQSPVDHVSAQKAIETSLASLDTYPKPDDTYTFPWAVFHGDGKPDLDVSTIVYQGTSMGGVLGLTYLAVTPGPLKGAYLQVPGVGVTDILSKSILYESELFRPLLPGFEDVFPLGISGDEAAVLFAGVQHKLDYADSANFVHHLRAPFPGRNPVPVAMQYGIGDGIVPNVTTEALLLMADIPLVKPVIEPVPGVRVVNKLENGYGALQVQPLSGDPDLNGHISFARKDAMLQLGSWLETQVWGR
ncbi:MAG TPA: hypothetical protein VFM46_08045, partial [Pseudomonadales bacterium]|nr:hypothetical protein [Pseudomonadales bacterium]